MKSLVPTAAGSQTREAFAGNEVRYPVKVAIVDDDENDRLQTTRVVDRSPDMEMVGSYINGLDAVERIPPSASEVVLMDARMPGVSGIEATMRLKDLHPALLIFMVSGFDDTQTTAEAKRAGADAFLTKPFSPMRFFQCLITCLRRRKFRCHAGPAKQGALAAVDSVSHPSDASQRSGPQNRSSGVEPGFLIDEPALRNALERIVIGLEGNFHTRQELLQEAWVHFWRRTRQCPGQRLSWYLQGVRFHLKDLKNSGCSVDSLKRRGAQVSFPEHCDDWDHWRDGLEFDEGFLSGVTCRDILSVLVDQLKGADKRIFDELAGGSGVCEIAQQLGVSHQSVIRSRQRIAALAIKLGIAPSSA